MFKYKNHALTSMPMPLESSFFRKCTATFLLVAYSIKLIIYQIVKFYFMRKRDVLLTWANNHVVFRESEYFNHEILLSGFLSRLVTHWYYEALIDELDHEGSDYSMTLWKR